eukprot:COSAG06_NODE_23384_length_693_cov_1.584175_1_plen_50_part_10
MGADPHAMIADNYARGVIPQAYSPLNHGSLPAVESIDRHLAPAVATSVAV